EEAEKEEPPGGSLDCYPRRGPPYLPLAKGDLSARSRNNAQRDSPLTVNFGSEHLPARLGQPGEAQGARRAVPAHCPHLLGGLPCRRPRHSAQRGAGSCGAGGAEELPSDLRHL
ncbi:unnamed protein product, partial [Prorocentrum cordatum]